MSSVPTGNTLLFRRRKYIHLSLVLGIILLQVILALLLVNKFYNQPKLKKYERDLILSEQIYNFGNITKDSYLSAQINLQNYILTKEEIYLQKYNASVNDLYNNIVQLDREASKNQMMSLYLKNTNIKQSLSKIDLKRDSLSQLKIPKYTEKEDYLLKEKIIKYIPKKDTVIVYKNVVVDSVKKKNLFARLGNAIRNKVEVQKEKEEIVISETKDSIYIEKITEEIDQLLANVHQYYKKEFEKYKAYHKAKNTSYQTENTDFIAANKELLDYSNKLIEQYNEALINFTNEARKKYNEQQEVNESIFNKSIMALIIVIVFISILLAILSKISYDYESQLSQAHQEIKQNLSFKNRIVSMISHEIRAPLNIISIYTKGIRRQVQEPEIKESLLSIEHTVGTLSMLANQILEFSKKQNKEMKLVPKQFSLEIELSEAFKSLQKMVEAKENKLIIQLPKNNTTVYSDPVKIHQLFYNIVGNANKFTSKGTITIDCNIQNNTDSTLKLSVQVKDTGKGIKKEELQHIFDQYHQGLISQQIKDIGMGLGLHLCKEIVELYNGEIQVQSTEGVGTTVKFYLVLPTQIPNKI